LPLCIEHGQKVPEAGRVKLPGELKGSLVLRHGCLESIAALLLLRVIHECVLGLFQRAQNRRLIEDLCLFQRAFCTATFERIRPPVNIGKLIAGPAAKKFLATTRDHGVASLAFPLTPTK